MSTTKKTAPRKRSSNPKPDPFDAPANEVPAGELLDIPVASIQLDDLSDRIDELLDAQAIDELASSIARYGLQHPIQVTQFGVGAGAEYRLVFGRRRLMAFKRLDRRTIPAFVSKYESDAQVLAAREVENIQRQQLNPIEEAMAVARMLELEYRALRKQRDGDVVIGDVEWHELDPRDKTLTVSAVATKLAKPEQWVRDRAFLAKLSGKSRQLVLEGRLPLMHAREIAKLADPNLRDKYAADFAIGGLDSLSDVEPGQIEDLREKVAQQLFSLAQVPWRLDAAFAGAKACSDCPHNSANQPQLFEHHSEAVKDHEQLKRAEWNRQLGKADAKAGVCTKPACFASKKAEANKAIGRASARVVGKVRAAGKKERAEVKRETLAAAVPAFIPRATIEKQVETKLAAKPKPAKKSSVPAHQRPPSAKSKAEELWRDAMRDRADALIPKLAALFKLNPGLFSIYHLFRETKTFRATQGSQEKRVSGIVNGAGMKALLELLKKPSFDTVLALEKDIPREYDLLDSWYDGTSGMADKIAEALEIDLGPVPKVEDFMPNGSKEEKSGVRGTCRVCGCTEDKACPRGCAWADASETLCSTCVGKEKP